MTFEDAHRALVERSKAANGAPADAPNGEIIIAEIDPEQHVRLLLSGVLEGDELERAVLGVEAIADNAMVALATAYTLSGRPESMHSTLQCLFGQQLLFGLLIGRD